MPLRGRLPNWSDGLRHDGDTVIHAAEEAGKWRRIWMLHSAQTDATAHADHSRGEVQPVPSGLCRFSGTLATLALKVGCRVRGALRKVLQQLRSAPIVGPIWEHDVLPLRLTNFQAADSTRSVRVANWFGLAAAVSNAARGRIRFFFFAAKVAPIWNLRPTIFLA